MQHNSARSREISSTAAKRFQWKGYYPVSRHNKTASHRSTVRVSPEKRSYVRRHLDRCSTSGKLRFRDKQEALNAVHAALVSRQFAEVDGSTTTRQERRAYSCASCHGWHITSQESWGGQPPTQTGAGLIPARNRIDKASGPRQVLLAIRAQRQPHTQAAAFANTATHSHHDQPPYRAI